MLVVDDEGHRVCSLEQIAADNADDETVSTFLRVGGVGDWIAIGGGATPPVVLVLVRHEGVRHDGT